ncbi:MAG: LamG-like jellyroll fold domain-containing protein, partial [Bacteroidota bacterium]
LGFAELKNFGLEISEPGRSDKESLVISGLKSTQLVDNNRVTNGLKLLYNFAEGEGDMVRDLSGTDPIMDLHISREGLATEWLVGQGLRINENTIISHEGQADGLIQELAATNEITLEAWIKQEEIEQSGPARIITLSSDNSERAATLAHEGNKAYYNYVSRLTTSKTDINGTPQLNTKQNFLSSSLHHVVYTRNSQGNEKIYVNGMVLASGKREGDFSSWDEDYQFALANEITGERPWQGILYLVALYNRALSSEEINSNYESGFGQIRFITELDTLESNVDYQLKPFISTDQGLVYGQSRNFIYQNVANTDSLLSIYPNPSNGSVFVTIKNRDENVKEGFIRLADFSGQVHFNKAIDLSEGLLEKIFELQLPASLQNGFYSLILIAGPCSVAEKFILMR